MSILLSTVQDEPIGYHWKIKKDGKTVAYLTGSVHITPDDEPYLNSKMQKCWSKSTKLAVERNVTLNSSLKERKKIYKNLAIQRLKNIDKDLIRKACISLQKIYYEKANIFDFSSEDEKIRFIRKYHKNLLIEAAKNLECSSGIDLYLIHQAKEKQIPVEELEELNEEMLKKPDNGGFEVFSLNILSSYEAQEFNDREELMNFYILRMSKAKEIIARVFWDKWKNGQSRSYETRPSILEETRNENIAKRIIELINEGGLPFCCVGCAHLMGENSVQLFLEKMGYTSTRILIREVPEEKPECLVQ